MPKKIIDWAEEYFKVIKKECGEKNCEVCRGVLQEIIWL